MGNKRSKGVLSANEERMVEAFIDDICHQLCLNIRNHQDARYYRNIGWEGFLEVYREQPTSFRGNGLRGWGSAALVIHEKLLAEKESQERSFFQEISLNAPVSAENDVPLIELLGPRTGDHQNSVCFWDYLDRLSLRDRDAAFLACRLIDQETLSEIQRVYHWTPQRVYRAFNTLKAAMEEYLSI